MFGRFVTQIVRSNNSNVVTTSGGMVGGSRFDLDSGKFDGREGVGNGVNDTSVSRDLPLRFGFGSTDLIMT